MHDFVFLKKDFVYLFLERGKGREKERNIIHTHLCLQLGLHPDQISYLVRSLTGNQTSNLSLFRMMPNQLSRTGQGMYL